MNFRFCPSNMMEIISKIHSQYDKTILMITHDLRLAAYADHMLVMKDGMLIKEGHPEVIYQDETLLASTQLLLPFELEVYEKAKKRKFKNDIVEALWAFNLKK